MKGNGFRHGVHPPERKELTSSLPIRRMPFPEEVVLPLRQHAGKPARPLVARGDRVERGDMIAAADGYISVPMHASAAGVVTAIDWCPHPDGSMVEAVHIRVDPHSVQVPRPRMVPRWETLQGDQVAAAVQNAGVVGMGGAAFPAHVKMVPPKDAKVEVLILNGAECEPYLTTDHRVMVEHPERVHYGARIMMAALGVDRAVIGVEANKPDAVERLRATIPPDLDITVEALRVKYPQGAEKMLIRAITGREVPSGKLPISVGAVVQNVGTVATIAEVFETGLPLIERVVTVTGRGIARPSNLLIPVGTRLRDVIEYCGGVTDDAAEIIFGGPMMGLVQADLDTPVTKGVTGIVVLTRAEIAPRRTLPCIKCGRCVDACPVFLVPQQLGALAQLGRFEEMEDWNLADCMLCGSCSYVCPSHIPLSQMFALSKAGLRRQKARSA
ncbi:MAG TPA: electron transport complex subunit RsxC [Longimicrobiales bacterium]|nr:electron transport complex subunit RsxC [Longimicrobiales bacterium]